MNSEEGLILNNAPLPESETAVALDLYSEDHGLKGGTLLKENGLEGKIIFDPERCLIFSIPPVVGATSEYSLLPERTIWDLYLIVIPFTLHEAPEESHYEKLIFFVDLADARATAFDLFPRHIVERGAADKTYVLAPHLKISDVEGSLSSFGRPIRFETLHPTITAFGEGRNQFYWVYKGTQEQKEVMPETKYTLAVLQVPHGTSSVLGTIKYQLTIAKKWYGIWTRREWKTTALPIHWELHTAQPLFGKESMQTVQRVTLPTNIVHSIHRAPKCDVLLVVATQIELQAVLTSFQEELDHSLQRHFINENTYYDLGVIGGVRIFLVQSEIGAGGPGGSLLTVQEGIRVLTPTAVIMVGIAFGIDPKKQRIGEILVSRQIVGYELQRIGSGAAGQMEITIRGDRSQASIRLLDRFRGSLIDWQGPEVHIGLILSGEKVVDHRGFRDRLRSFEPEAIGGEMEGAGLYAAAQRNRVDWILIKAICDWADGKKAVNKSQHQQLAARNAASFTIHVLKQGGFAEPP